MRVFLGGAAVVLALMVSGCGDKAADQPVAAPVPTGPPWFDETKSAPSVGTLSACPMPVKFDLAEDWKATRILPGEADILGELFAKGGARVTCEIDGKPAGQIGFLRVWTVDGGERAEPRKALETFIATEKGATEITYRDLQTGDLPAAEVTYLTPSDLDDGEKERERAVAVAAPRGTVLLVLDSLDSSEFEGILPAYLLARDTMVGV